MNRKSVTGTEYNIKLANQAAYDEEVAKACIAANCDKFIVDLDHGYDVIVGENGNRLLGGERQRISIARAILKDSPVILLDEATASLDIENEIAHNLSVIQNADHILVLSKGKIAERGTHNDLMQKRGKYYTMWQVQNQEAG